jgi:3-hydroxyisobutyrate dehydrogenase-like beta-hydroxyacid dehydrogenase
MDRDTILNALFEASAMAEGSARASETNQWLKETSWRVAAVVVLAEALDADEDDVKKAMSDLVARTRNVPSHWRERIPENWFNEHFSKVLWMTREPKTADEENYRTERLAVALGSLAVWLTDALTSDDCDIEKEIVTAGLAILSILLGASDEGIEKLNDLVRRASDREFEMGDALHAALIADIQNSRLLLASNAWRKTLAQSEYRL